MLGGRDVWRAPALAPARPVDPHPLPVNQIEGPPAARPVTRDAIDGGSEGLATQVRAMQQRIDELETQVHTIDAGPPTPRRGFDDLAGRDSRAGD